MAAEILLDLRYGQWGLEGNPEAKLRRQDFAQKANRYVVEKMNPWHQTR